MNDIIKQSLSAAHVPSRLEPTGLLRSDGRRLDGATLAPWKSGCLLVWDVTCPDTFALSYRAHATQEPGKVAATAEERKSEKYRGLPPGHMFSPIAIETLGAIGPKSLPLLKDLGRRIRSELCEPKSTEYIPAPAAISGSSEGELYIGSCQHRHLTLILLVLLI